MAEVMIPPWVRPESPETLRIIDDATVALQPAFGRGMTQRGIWADPRWGLRRRYRGLRSDEKAAILNALNETRGQFNVLRVTPHSPIRGSFPATEQVSNNSFATGTTGWSSSQHTLSVSDRMLRLLKTGAAAAASVSFTGLTGLTQYAPYAMRAFARTGRGSFFFRAAISDSLDGTTVPSAIQTDAMSVHSYVLNGTTATAIIRDEATSGIAAGDYFSVPYTSFARCALVDNGPQLLLNSDTIGGTSWSNNSATVGLNAAGDPYGGSTDRYLIETAASAAHYSTQSITVSSSAADYCVSCFFRAGIRSWAWIELLEATGSTVVRAWVNLSTGALGTTSTGVNWSNLRAFVRDFGGGWYRLIVVARKSNAATTLQASFGAATADNTLSYLGGGGGTPHIYLWRAGIARSSVPTRDAQTTSSALSSGTTQSGSGLHTKGWPISTNGLLLAGDWFEWQGELKQLSAPVNSDAVGLAYMQFRPGLAGSPADNDPIIVQEPFGRFIYPAGAREIENQFGIYADCSMELEEVYV